MINLNKCGIGISQAVPMDVMIQGVRHLLQHGNIAREEISQALTHYPRGANRLNKMRLCAQKILCGTNQDILALTKLCPSVSSNVLLEHEIKLLAIALTALAYPALYHLLVIVAQQFKVQSVVSRAFIKQKMGDIYGGNRALEIGIDAIIPMLLEAGLLQRKSVGLYTKGQVDSRIISRNICEYWVRTDLVLSKSKAFSSDELIHHPWNFYCLGVEQITVSPQILKIEKLSNNKFYIKL